MAASCTMRSRNSWSMLNWMSSARTIVAEVASDRSPAKGFVLNVFSFLMKSCLSLAFPIG
jgi:hypothetical protein